MFLDFFFSSSRDSAANNNIIRKPHSWAYLVEQCICENTVSFLMISPCTELFSSNCTKAVSEIGTTSEQNINQIKLTDWPLIVLLGFGKWKKFPTFSRSSILLFFMIYRQCKIVLHKRMLTNNLSNKSFWIIYVSDLHV